MTAKKTLKLTLEEYGYKLSDLIYPPNGLEMAIVEAMERHAKDCKENKINNKLKKKTVAVKRTKNKSKVDKVGKDGKSFFERWDDVIKKI